MTQPYDPAKVDEFLDAFKAAQKSLLVKVDAHVEFGRLVNAYDALRPPMPAKDYVLPEWCEFTGDRTRAGPDLFRVNVWPGVYVMVDKTQYNAIRELFPREPMPVKSIPAGSEWSEEDLKLVYTAWYAANSRQASWRIAIDKIKEITGL
jgi:hypothetical protein